MHTVVVALLYQIPEGLMVVLGGLGLLGIKAPFRPLFAAGLAYGALIPVVRSLGLPFGVHTVVLLVLFVGLTTRLVRIGTMTAIAGWMFASFLLNLGEHLITAPLRQAMGLGFAATIETALAHVLWGWSSAALLLLATLATVLTPLVLLPAPETNEVAVRR